MSETSAKHPSLYRKYLTEGVVLASIPIVIYLIKFIYDSGYGAFFKVPPNFTSFSLPEIFPTLLLALFGTLVILNTMAAGINVKSKLNNSYSILLENTLLLLLFASFILVYSPSTFRFRYLFLILTFVVVVRHFILPLLWHRNIAGYFNKVSKHLDLLPSRRESFAEYLWDFATYRVTRVLILLIGVSFFLFFVGFNQAKNQTEFYLISSDPTWAVVRFNDDKVLLVDIENKNQVGSQLRYQSLISDHLSLVRKKIGPLKNGDK